MRKLLVIALLAVISCVSVGNIVEFFESIPPIVKYGIGAGIALYGLSWAWNWIFEPIVIVGDNPYGAFCFGPVIAVDRYIWYEWEELDRNYMLNHEYTHYIQHALFGPVMSLTYPIFCLYSTLKTGNRWDGNYWEIQAMQAPDTAPSWKPLAVWVW
jgi:hypothetical protein